MMLALVFAGALQLAPNNASEQSWSMRASVDRASVSMRTVFRRQTPSDNWDSEHSFDVSSGQLSARFRGLSREELFSGSPVRVAFAVVHDAGSVNYTGSAGNGSASGDFTVRPNPEFTLQLRRRGIGTPTPDEQLEFTLAGADYAYLDLLTTLGFERPDVRQFLRLLEHGVSPDYLRAMAGLHLTSRSIDAIVRARDHGVDPEMFAAFKAAGYSNIPLEQLVRLRDHGVSAEFIAGMGRAGYRNLTTEDLIRLMDHGVSPSYIDRLRHRGYTANLSVEDLIRLRDNGI